MTDNEWKETGTTTKTYQLTEGKEDVYTAKVELVENHLSTIELYLPDVFLGVGSIRRILKLVRKLEKEGVFVMEEQT